MPDARPRGRYSRVVVDKSPNVLDESYAIDICVCCQRMAKRAEKSGM